MDFYGRQLNTYKANLHTHSTISDGRFTPEEVIRLYSEHGYQVLSMSEHGKTNPIASYDSQGMTLLSGIELHPQGPHGIDGPSRWHLLACGVPVDFPGEFETGQQAIDAVNAVGGIVFAAHPYWCGFTSAEVMSLKGVVGTEVYNTSTRYIGKAYNMQIWDEILNMGHHYSALAVDDFHRDEDFGKGWTVICAENRDPASLITALKAGDFYSSQGPEIYRLSFKDGIFEAEFSPCMEAILVSGGPRGFCGRVQGRPDAEATSIRRDLNEWKPRRYIRLQLLDREGRYAWSMPLYFNE